MKQAQANPDFLAVVFIDGERAGGPSMMSLEAAEAKARGLGLGRQDALGAPSLSRFRVGDWPRSYWRGHDEDGRHVEMALYW